MYIYIYIYIYMYDYLGIICRCVINRVRHRERERVRESSYVFSFFSEPSRKQSPHGFAQVPNHPQCPTSGPCWWRRLEGESSVNTGMTKTPILGFFDGDAFQKIYRRHQFLEEFFDFFSTHRGQQHIHNAISAWNISA